MLDTDEGATIVSDEESDDEPKTIRGKIAKVRTRANCLFMWEKWRSIRKPLSTDQPEYKRCKQ